MICINCYYKYIRLIAPAVLDYLEKSKTCTINGNFYFETDYKASDNDPFYKLRLLLLPMYCSRLFLKMFSGDLKKLNIPFVMPEFSLLTSYLFWKERPDSLKIL